MIRRNSVICRRRHDLRPRLRDRRLRARNADGHLPGRLGDRNHRRARDFPQHARRQPVRPRVVPGGQLLRDSRRPAAHAATTTASWLRPAIRRRGAGGCAGLYTAAMRLHGGDAADDRGAGARGRGDDAVHPSARQHPAGLASDRYDIGYSQIESSPACARASWALQLTRGWIVGRRRVGLHRAGSLGGRGLPGLVGARRRARPTGSSSPTGATRGVADLLRADQTHGRARRPRIQDHPARRQGDLLASRGRF